jgi:hypothetical protein
VCVCVLSGNVCLDYDPQSQRYCESLEVPKKQSYLSILALLCSLRKQAYTSCGQAAHSDPRVPLSKYSRSSSNGNRLQCRFCAGDVTIEAFQQQHLKLRQAYHERDIKRQAAEQTLM